MLKSAAEIVKDGGVIVYPTDTVWGIGCNALDKKAVERLNKMKNRPDKNGLIWLFPSIKAVKKHFPEITSQEEKLLLKKRTTVIIANQGVRVVKNGWLNKLLALCGVPLVSTSANLHGQPTITSWRQGVRVFGSADAVIRGRKIANGKPSTVAKIENGQTSILRAGGGISIK